MAKRGIAHYEQFLFLPQCFEQYSATGGFRQKACYTRGQKTQIYTVDEGKDQSD